MPVFSIETADPDETLRLGARFAELLRAGDVIALIGELGTGKTHFVRGICSGLGYLGAVTSPTFTLMHHYPGVLPVYHFDCFRMRTPAEISTTGFDEYVSSGLGLILVEWADRIQAYFDDWTCCIHFDFAAGGENRRSLEFHAREGRFAGLSSDPAET